MLRRLILAAFTMVLAAVTMVGLTGGTAGATPRQVAAGTVAVKSMSSGLCMDIGSNTPGVIVGITHCASVTSQAWYFMADGTVRNFNGLCMDIGSNAPGTKVGLAYCRPGYLSQQWQHNGSDLTIRNYNGLCVDIGSNAPGTPIGITGCRAGFTSQQWYFQ